MREMKGICEEVIVAMWPLKEENTDDIRIASDGKDAAFEDSSEPRASESERDDGRVGDVCVGI